jgi:hypothetical protein
MDAWIWLDVGAGDLELVVIGVLFCLVELAHRDPVIDAGDSGARSAT